MKKLNPKEVVAEIKCPACEGTGFSKVKQPAEPGHRIYPAPCRNARVRGELRWRVHENALRLRSSNPLAQQTFRQTQRREPSKLAYGTHALVFVRLTHDRRFVLVVLFLFVVLVVVFIRNLGAASYCETVKQCLPRSDVGAGFPARYAGLPGHARTRWQECGSSAHAPISHHSPRNVAAGCNGDRIKQSNLPTRVADLCPALQLHRGSIRSPTSFAR